MFCFIKCKALIWLHISLLLTWIVLNWSGQTLHTDAKQTSTYCDHMFQNPSILLSHSHHHLNNTMYLQHIFQRLTHCFQNCSKHIQNWTMVNFVPFSYRTEIYSIDSFERLSRCSVLQCCSKKGFWMILFGNMGERRQVCMERRVSEWGRITYFYHNTEKIKDIETNRII